MNDRINPELPQVGGAFPGGVFTAEEATLGQLSYCTLARHFVDLWGQALIRDALTAVTDILPPQDRLAGMSTVRFHRTSVYVNLEDEPVIGKVKFDFWRGFDEDISIDLEHVIEGHRGKTVRGLGQPTELDYRVEGTSDLMIRVRAEFPPLAW